MRDFKRFSAAAVVVILTMVLGMFAAAEAYGGRGGGMRLGRMLDSLDLSADQKHQVAAILKSHRDEAQAGISAVIQAREKLMAVVTGPFNEAAVREAYRGVAAAQENMTVLRAKGLSEIMAILTPEQQTQLQAKIAKAAARLKNVGARRQSWIDHWIEQNQ